MPSKKPTIKCCLYKPKVFIVNLLIFWCRPYAAKTNAQQQNSYSGRGPIVGQTPCCIDRLTSIVCQNQKQKNLSQFLHKCMQNSDFAFVQCCKTCFDQSNNDAYRLDYKKTSEFLLTDPLTAQCRNRRGKQWCSSFSSGKMKWMNAKKTRLDCSNVPLAFRLCRETCGYCSTNEMPAQAVYHYPVAKDAYKCRNPSKGIAQLRINTSLRPSYQKFAERFARRKKPVSSAGSVSPGRKQYRLGRPINRGKITEAESRLSNEESVENVRGKTENRKLITQEKHTTTHPSTTTDLPNDYFVVEDHGYDYEDSN